MQDLLAYVQQSFLALSPAQALGAYGFCLAIFFPAYYVQLSHYNFFERTFYYILYCLLITLLGFAAIFAAEFLIPDYSLRATVYGSVAAAILIVLASVYFTQVRGKKHYIAWTLSPSSQDEKGDWDMQPSLAINERKYAFDSPEPYLELLRDLKRRNAGGNLDELIDYYERCVRFRNTARLAYGLPVSIATQAPSSPTGSPSTGPHDAPSPSVPPQPQPSSNSEPGRRGAPPPRVTLQEQPEQRAVRAPAPQASVSFDMSAPPSDHPQAADPPKPQRRRDPKDPQQGLNTAFTFTETGGSFIVLGFLALMAIAPTIAFLKEGFFPALIGTFIFGPATYAYWKWHQRPRYIVSETEPPPPAATAPPVSGNMRVTIQRKEVVYHQKTGGLSSDTYTAFQIICYVTFSESALAIMQHANLLGYVVADEPFDDDSPGPILVSHLVGQDPVVVTRRELPAANDFERYLRESLKQLNSEITLAVSKPTTGTETFEL